MFDCEPRGAAGHLPALCPGGCAVCTTSLRSDLRNPETLNQMWRPSRLVLVEKRFLTAHVGVVDDRFAPRAPAVVFVGAHAKLVGGVGFQVVDDGFAGWAGLVDPLPVPLSVADGVEPETRKRQITTWKRQRKDPRTTEGVPQGSVRPSTRFIVTCSSPGGWIKDVPGRVADSSGEPKAKVSSETKKKRRAQAGGRVLVGCCGPILAESLGPQCGKLFQLAVVNSGLAAESVFFRESRMPTEPCGSGQTQDPKNGTNIRSL